MVKRWNGPSKEQVRLGSITKGKKYRNVLDLPAAQCLSIKNLVNHSALYKGAKFTLFEKKSQIVPQISRGMSRLGFKQQDYTVIGKEVAGYHTKGVYDWVNLDTCSSLSRPMLSTIYNMEFEEGGELNVWLTYYRSNGEFHQNLRHTFLRSESMKVGQEIVNRHRESFEGCEPTKRVTAMALVLAMRKYNFTLERPQDYADQTVRMFFFRMKNIKRLKTPELPYFQDIYKECENYEMDDYPAKAPRQLTGEDSIIEMIVKVASGAAASSVAFLTKRMRQEIRAKVAQSKTSLMVKAGWKSTISRLIKNATLRKSCHDLIDNV